MINKLLLLNINKRWYDRYSKIITSCYGYNSEGEVHHILPVSLYPEYRLETNNKILVPYRVHYILHYILFKMFNPGKCKDLMGFAFNQMNRISKNSYVFRKNRKEIAKIVSRTNKGRKHYHSIVTKINYTTKDKDFKLPKGFQWGQSYSKKRVAFYQNNILVRDKSDRVFYITKEKFNTQTELIDARIGRKHTDETKKLMSKNGIKDKSAYYDDNLNCKYLSRNDIIPKGFTKGKPKKLREKQSNIIKKKKSWFNPTSKESIRIEGKPPDGFIKGRGPFNNKGNKGMKFYHLGEKEIMAHKKPPGWFEGKQHIHPKVYNELGYVGTFSKLEIEVVFCKELLKATEDKPIGHNIAYHSRLKEECKKWIGYYIK